MTLEEMQQQVLDLQETIKAMKIENETLTATNAELVERNTKLVEHNNKLFARVSEPVQQEPKQLTEEEREAQVIAEIRQEMKKFN